MRRFNPDIHHRRSIRLPRFDYSRPGAYLITICTQGRLPLFGQVVSGEMQCNDAGVMIKATWEEVSHRYPEVAGDAFIVMPDHLHGIIVLKATVGARPSQMQGQPQRAAPTRLSLPGVVHRLKSLTTARYREGVKKCGWPPFPNRLWQRNYYEHIIRSDGEMNQIREYILLNPARWSGKT